MTDLARMMSNLNGLTSERRLIENRILTANSDILAAIKESGLTRVQVEMMPEFRTYACCVLIQTAFQPKPPKDNYELGA